MNEQEQRQIVISPAQLPVFSMVNAAHIAYNAAIVRLANSLNLGAFEPIDTFLYRVYIKDPLTGEACCIVQKGADNFEPTGLSFEVFISYMAILQIKLYQATYSGGGATIYISEDNIISKTRVLFVERPEFDLWDVMCRRDDSAEEEEEDSEEETPSLPATATKNS